MNAKIIVLIVTALFIRCSVFAQKVELPVVKANSVDASIKEDGISFCCGWKIVPEIELDVFKTSAKEVTFYTDIDSISFAINPKMKEYDFIVLLNEKDSARTQIKYEKQSRDIKEYFANSFEVFTTIAANKPENFDPRAINQGFRHSVSYRIPLGKSNFSLGIGAGISFHNYYIDALPKDVLPVSMQSDEYGDGYYFVKIASISEPEISYKKNKMTLTYIDIPFELKYYNKKNVKISVGAKVDFPVRSCFKFKGSDFVFGSDTNIKLKKYNLAHITNYQIGPMVRIGWKACQIYASYSFTPVYDADAGSKLNPICVGLSITPLW